MRLLDALRSASDRLERAGIEDPHVDAELLVLHASGLDRLSAYTENPEIDRMLSSRISALVRRRLKAEPVQYIVGSVDFHGLSIKVAKGVLIPRPETELLVLEAIKTVQRSKFEVQGSSENMELGTSNLERVSILDLCTGSGCIALAVARDLPDALVLATEISPKAIRIAKKNADENKIRNVSFLRGSLFEPVPKAQKFDLIVSNPPYIRTDDIPALQREVRDWEPRGALDGGQDGLDFYRSIIPGAYAHLKGHGMLLLEIGYDQGEAVSTIAREAGFKGISVMKDYAGLDRIVKAKKP